MVIEKHFEETIFGECPGGAVEEESKPTCRHHWVIETANGPVSWGVCQVCHEGKEFRNSIGDIDRDP